MNRTITTCFFLLLLNYQLRAQVEAGENAPEIIITDWIKQYPDNNDFKNKFLILNFFDVSNKQSVQKLEDNIELLEQFKDKIHILSLSSGKRKELKANFNEIDFIGAVGIDSTFQTRNNFLLEDINAADYPVSILIDMDNKVKWIGDTHYLDNFILKSFVSGKSDLPTIQELEMENEDVLIDRFKSFNEWFKYVNQTKDYYLSIEKNKQKNPMNIEIENGFASESITLRDLLAKVWNTSDEYLGVSKKIKRTYYQILYINKNPKRNLYNELATDILKKLDLQLKEEKVEVNGYEIEIGDISKFIDPKHENYISKKIETDNSISFRTYTPDDMLTDLSSKSGFIFKHNINISSQYDFEIKFDTEANLINSLNKYGFNVKPIKTFAVKRTITKNE